MAALASSDALVEVPNPVVANPWVLAAWADNQDAPVDQVDQVEVAASTLRAEEASEADQEAWTETDLVGVAALAA